MQNTIIQEKAKIARGDEYKYKWSEVGGNTENQVATFKTGICLGQPVGE